MTWGRERESGFHLLKVSLNSSPGESSCYCRTGEEAVEEAVKEGGQGWAGGHVRLVLKPEALCAFCVLLTVTSVLCLARGSPSRCSHLVSLLLSSPPLPSLTDFSMQRLCPAPASFLSLPPPWLWLGLCVCVLGLNICNSRSALKDAMPFPHISSGRLNCVPHL